jgi:mono/diheme cytochrome c family protein
MRVILIVAIVLLVSGVIYTAASWQPSIPALPDGKPQQFAADDIGHGAALAALGSCAVCHTKTNGDEFAGDRAITTPFGTVFSTNITPDSDTGLGRWPESAFVRAMTRGVDREGHYLYPAFPYDHFTHITPRDLHDLYAYLMTRPAATAKAHKNDLYFPLSIRQLVAVWDWLYLKPGPAHASAGSAAQKRGAYLVEGLGHCGACHSPRNILGAEKQQQALSGGDADGWDAYALTARSASPTPWTIESLNDYLRSGWHADHGLVGPPMLPVAQGLARSNEEDTHAIAAYLLGLASTQPRPDAPVRKAASTQGAALYESSCAACHDGSRALPLGGIPLRSSSLLSAPGPRNALTVLLEGVPAADSQIGPIMPDFAYLDDAQLAALLQYLRIEFGRGDPWQDLEGHIHKVRNEVGRRDAT